MPYAKIETSGCEIRKDRIKLRLDCFLNPTEPNYDKHHVFIVDWNSPEAIAGYQGEVNAEGDPIDLKDYQQWEDSLPHIWVNTPFHSHMIHPVHTATDNEVKANIIRCLGYFYAFHQHCWDGNKPFIDEWKKVPFQEGKVRHRFIAGKPKDKNKNNNRLQDILSRIEEFEVGIAPVSEAIHLNIGKRGTIDIGADAINRNTFWSTAYTLLALDNLANDSGEIDTWEIWAYADMTGCKVGTFFIIGGDTYECRDVETIGSVTAGSKQSFTGCTTTVVTSDRCAGYAATGSWEKSNSGFAGFRHKGSGGDVIIASQQTDFSSLLSGDAISLYGTGDGAGQDYPISTSCSILVSPSVDGAFDSDRGMSASLSLSPSVSRKFDSERATSSNLSLAATIARSFAKTITTSSALSLAVTIVKGAGKAIATSCNLALAVSVGRALTYTRALSNDLSLATTIVRSFGRTIVTSSALSLAVTIIRATGTAITTSCSLALSVSVSRTVTYTRAISSALSLAVSISRAIAVIRTTSNNLSLAVSVSRAFGKIITTSVALSLTTAVSRVVAYTRTATSNLSLAVTIVATAVTVARYLAIKVLTLQYRNTKVSTAQHRFITILTSQYRKIRTLLLGE